MKKAFTLTELLVVFVIMGILAVAMIQNFQSRDYTTKQFAAFGIKGVELFEQAAARIKEVDTVNCPLGTFLSKRGGKSDFTIEIKDSSGNSIDAEETANLFAKYIRYEGSVVNFCSNTGYSSCSGTIKGYKIPGGKMYIGFKVFSTPADCPAYRMPNDTADVTPTYFEKNTGEFKTAQCWGEYYIDTNGKEPPNERGKDVLVFGMGEYGLAK